MNKIKRLLQIPSNNCWGSQSVLWPEQSPCAEGRGPWGQTCREGWLELLADPFLSVLQRDEIIQFLFQCFPVCLGMPGKPWEAFCCAFLLVSSCLPPHFPEERLYRPYQWLIRANGNSEWYRIYCFVLHFWTFFRALLWTHCCCQMENKKSLKTTY